MVNDVDPRRDPGVAGLPRLGAGERTITNLYLPK